MLGRWRAKLQRRRRRPRRQGWRRNLCRPFPERRTIRRCGAGKGRRTDRRGLQAHGARSPCLGNPRQQYAGAEPLPADLRSRARRQLLGCTFRAAAPRRHEAGRPPL